VGDPLVDEYEKLLPTAYRSEAERAGLRQVPQQVVAALAGRADAALTPPGQQLVAPELVAARERVHGKLTGALDDSQVEVQLSAAGGGTDHRPRCRELEHPAEVLGRDQVQGAAHRPRSDDLAGVECRLDALHRA